MEEKCGKFFIKENIISAIEYNTQSDYYKFVRNYSDAGYYQVILNSTIMLEILKEYFITRKFDIIDIALMEEDNDSCEEIRYLITEINKNRDKFIYLIEKLRFLNDNSSIEIKRIELKFHHDNNSIYLYLQVNGIFGVNTNSYNEEVKSLIPILERNLS
jgi:hypothetical protein